MADAFFPPLPVFAPFAGGAAVRVEEISAPCLATLMVRQGQAEILARTIRERFGVDLPTDPRLVGNGDTAFIGTGPGVWLAKCGHGGPAFARDLAEAVGEAASVSDQSSGYALLRLSGSRVRAVLQKGVPIDLHPDAFPQGSAAVTMIAHIGTMIWIGEDDAFELAFFRSMAGSFRHWLEAAIASPD